MVSTLDLSHSLLGLYGNGQTHLVAWESGPPPNIDGYVIGTPVMTQPAPSSAGESGLFRARAQTHRAQGQDPGAGAAEARALLDSIDATTAVGLRDRALIGLMVLPASVRPSA
jgi:hypothetical protein